VETKKKQTIIPPSSSAPTTSTRVVNLPASSATVLTTPSVKSESEDEDNDSRRYKAYKLPPNVPKSTVTCYKCNCQGHYSHDCRSAASSVLKVSTDRSTAARSTVKSRPQYKQAITFTRSDVDTLFKM
jgi:hypothetical protein